MHAYCEDIETDNIDILDEQSRQQLERQCNIYPNQLGRYLNRPYRKITSL